MTNSMSSEWQAVCHVLDHPALRGRVDVFLEHDSEYLDSAIRDEPWSMGERILIDIALAIHSSEEKVSLRDAFSFLDTENARRVLQAIDIMRIGFGCSPALLGQN